MNWKERFLWELGLSKKLLTVPLLPKDQWQEKLLDHV